MIIVKFPDDTFDYPDLVSASEGILEYVMADSEHVVLPDDIVDENTGKKYGCSWSVVLDEL